MLVPPFPGFTAPKPGFKFSFFQLLGCPNQRKTKGQQLKGKIVSALFSHFLALFHTVFTLFQSFSEFFLEDFFLELRGFTTVLVQRDEKRIKDNKKKKTKSFCTLVVARLSSSHQISPGLSLGQTRFVPGTIPGTKGGTESLCENSLCAFFARYFPGFTAPTPGFKFFCFFSSWGVQIWNSWVLAPATFGAPHLARTHPEPIFG